MRTSAGVVLLLGALLLSGCTTVKPGFAMREWSKNMRELGIVPVYPPREDVQVGDVYVYSIDPEDEKLIKENSPLIGTVPRWAKLELRTQLDALYKARPEFPKTEDACGFPDNESATETQTAKADPAPADAGKDNGKAQLKPAVQKTDDPKPKNDKAATDTSHEPPVICHQPVEDTSAAQYKDIFDPSRTWKAGRLRLVGFPEFAATTFSQGDLSALIPIESVNLALGAGWSDNKSVTIKVPAAESYGVPAKAALDALLEAVDDKGETCEPKKNTCKYRLKSDYRMSLTPSQDHPYVWVRVITEVYYARALDIAVQSKKTAGGQASANSQAGAFNATAATSAVARAEALNGWLEKTQSQSTPGGSFHFVSASDASVSMRRVWEHGVAIGFRGMTLKISNATGEVLSGVASNSTVPTVQ